MPIKHNWTDDEIAQLAIENWNKQPGNPALFWNITNVETFDLSRSLDSDSTFEFKIKKKWRYRVLYAIAQFISFVFTTVVRKKPKPCISWSYQEKYLNVRKLTTTNVHTNR